MEKLTLSKNGQWNLEKVKQADVGVTSWAQPLEPHTTKIPATPAPAPNAAPAAPVAAPKQADLGQYWKKPKPNTDNAKTIDYGKMNTKAAAPAAPINTIDYGKLNEIKNQEAAAPTVNYEGMESPKPKVENLAALKGKLQEARRQAGKGPPPVKRAIEEMKVRQTDFNTDRAKHAVKPKQ